MQGSYTKDNNTKDNYIWQCGGFSEPFSSFRNVKLSFAPTSIDTLLQTPVMLKANVLEWFK